MTEVTIMPILNEAYWIVSSLIDIFLLCLRVIKVPITKCRPRSRCLYLWLSSSLRASKLSSVLLSLCSHSHRWIQDSSSSTCSLKPFFFFFFLVTAKSTPSSCSCVITHSSEDQSVKWPRRHHRRSPTEFSSANRPDASPFLSGVMFAHQRRGEGGGEEKERYRFE